MGALSSRPWVGRRAEAGRLNVAGRGGAAVVADPGTDHPEPAPAAPPERHPARLPVGPGHRGLPHDRGCGVGCVRPLPQPAGRRMRRRKAKQRRKAKNHLTGQTPRRATRLRRAFRGLLPDVVFVPVYPGGPVGRPLDQEHRKAVCRAADGGPNDLHAAGRCQKIADEVLVAVRLRESFGSCRGVWYDGQI